MFLPNNGKVVVFDDKQKDIENLLRALSMTKIPFLYYQDEGGNDLPESPIENIRLIFLDLELVVNNPDKHNIISPIAARIKRVISKNNIYVLAYWSTKEDTYREVLEKAFEEGLKDYKPVKIISLNKAEANSNGNPLEYITDALMKEMNDFNSINAFFLWESAVNDAAGRITNEISTLINKNKWDNGIYGLLHKLSKAQAGPNTLDDQDNYSKLNLAFELINNSLVEACERVFNERLDIVKIGDIKEGGRELQAEEKLTLNTRIHILNSDKLKHFYSGNLYIENINAIGKEIISRNFKNNIHNQFSYDEVKLVCLDVTPSCDYAQRKHYTRILYGVMVNGHFRKEIQPGDGKYKEIPLIDINGSKCVIFDYRTIRSFTREEFLHRFKLTPKYRLRNNTLLDIQAQLSNHINRPGIVSIS